MSLAIQAHDLVKTYRGGVRALDGLSVEAGTGTVIGLLGPNGAGKSTAVKVLTTLARPDSGHAEVAGVDLLRHPAQVRLKIGAVGQKSAVDRSATGRDNLGLQAALYGMRGRETRARIDELLGRFGLVESADRVVETYSGGMQRKLDVAMGLVHRPEVLFLDEPTTGLDPDARADLWAEVERLSGDEGVTILLTTHYLEEADRLADRVAIVDTGRVVAEGTPDELKAELRGDAVHVELGDEETVTAAVSSLERVGGVGEVSSSGRIVRARVDRGASAVPGILSALETSGVRVTAVTVARPSLDDVYLRHTGRTFVPAEEYAR